MFYYERRLKKKGYQLIIGVDEAGRGPLAGPVVAAAVVLKQGARFRNRIDDSKKLTALEREKAFPEIIKKSVYGIGVISQEIIDRQNILVATKLAMERAVGRAVNKLDRSLRMHIIVDGNISLKTGLPNLAIIGGDAKSKTIAAASILAKVIRDRIMLVYDRMYPEYGFIKHKGYPTGEHRAVLKRLGPCPIHRRTFSYA